MPAITVPGSHGQTVALSFDTPANTVLAQRLVDAITAGVNAGSIVPAMDTAGPPLPLPPGKTGEFIQTQDGTTFLPPGYTAFVDTASKAVIFGSGDPNESVLIGPSDTTVSDTTFIARGATGSGTVVAGGGSNTVFIPTTVTGGWSINTGNGDDNILAAGTGSDTINAGGGHNAITLGSGNDVLLSTGDDTVNAGSGSETITAIGTGSDVIFGGPGTLLFVATGGSATIFGGSGSDTFLGGPGRAVVHGGTGGNNLLFGGTGATTLFGGGNGDQLTAANGSAAQALHAGAGNETLFGGFSRGLDTFYGGTGNASITAGSGTNLFVFTDGQAGGTASIQGFASSRDQVDLQGYGKNEVAQALKSQSVVGGTDTITLSDHTTISFANVSSLTVSDFGAGVLGNTGGTGNTGGQGNDDGQQGHGHQSHGDMDDHGQIRNLLLGDH
jgi:Ca2+-binding RTX toxin-like protein